jgi:uncharacterized protein YbaR (Trm112 family)
MPQSQNEQLLLFKTRTVDLNRTDPDCPLCKTKLEYSHAENTENGRVYILECPSCHEEVEVSMSAWRAMNV